MEQMEIQEIVATYNDYASKVEHGCLFIAESLREEEVAVAINSIVDFSEGMSWLMEVASKLQTSDLIKEIDFAKITDFLNEINEGLVKQDYILVADIFEYEIAEYFHELNSIEGV